MAPPLPAGNGGARHLACGSSHPLSRTRWGRLVGSRSTPPRRRPAHTRRAVLFATAVRCHPRRVSNPRLHGRRRSVRRSTPRSVARAPCLSRGRTSRAPRVLSPPQRVCPPVACCVGPNPPQAAHGRPCLTLPTGPPAAIRAVAIIGPLPGIVISRGHSGWGWARLARVCGAEAIGSPQATHASTSCPHLSWLNAVRVSVADARVSPTA
jgi:hypothetical protein